MNVLEIKIWGYELLIDTTDEVVTKLIYAHDPLSIQMHEDKDEVFTAVTHSVIYEGILPSVVMDDPDLTLESFSEYCSKQLPLILQRHELSPLDSLVVPKGRIHYIEHGKVMEVSKGTQKTLRLHDWNRGRELDLEYIFNKYHK